MSRRAVAYYRVPRTRDTNEPPAAQARRVIRLVRAQRWTLIEPFVETS